MLVCAGAEGLGKLSFANCTSRIMHHVYPPPQFYITFVFHFSWVLQSSREKLKTMLMQNVWVGGQTRCTHIVGNLQMENKYASRAKMINRLNRRYHAASWFKRNSRSSEWMWLKFLSFTLLCNENVPVQYSSASQTHSRVPCGLALFYYLIQLN